MLKNLFMSWRYLGVAVISLGMAACSTLPTPPTGTNAIQRQYNTDITLSGRLSIFYEKNTEKKAAHGSFNWDQANSITHVDLFSPLGQTIAKITLTPINATLEQGDYDPVTADDADMLTETVLGWPLPIKGLKDWLQGFGENEKHQPFVASPNNESPMMTDSGWRITYLRWNQNSQGKWYPGRINLDRHSEEAGEIAIRIVIDSSEAKK